MELRCINYNVHRSKCMRAEALNMHNKNRGNRNKSTLQIIEQLVHSLSSKQKTVGKLFLEKKVVMGSFWNAHKDINTIIITHNRHIGTHIQPLTKCLIQHKHLEGREGGREGGREEGEGKRGKRKGGEHSKENCKWMFNCKNQLVVSNFCLMCIHIHIVRVFFITIAINELKIAQKTAHLLQQLAATLLNVFNNQYYFSTTSKHDLLAWNFK